MDWSPTVVLKCIIKGWICYKSRLWLQQRLYSIKELHFYNLTVVTDYEKPKPAQSCICHTIKSSSLENNFLVDLKRPTILNCLFLLVWTSLQKPELSTIPDFILRVAQSHIYWAKGNSCEMWNSIKQMH